MSDTRYPRLFRGGDPERAHDDISDRSRNESDLEQTSIHPHQTSKRTSQEVTGNSAHRNTSSSQRRSDNSQESGTRTASHSSRSTSAPKHAAGAGSRLDRSFRRCATLTIASTLLPGLGLAGARQRWAKILGVLLPIGFLGGLIWLAVRAVMNPEKAVSWVLRPGLLRGALVVLIIIAVG